MIDLESKFEVLEAEVKEISANKETLKKNLLDLIELQHILNKAHTFFLEVGGWPYNIIATDYGWTMKFKRTWWSSYWMYM